MKTFFVSAFFCILLIGCDFSETRDANEHLRQICTDLSCKNIKIPKACSETRDKIIKLEQRIPNVDVKNLKILILEHENCLKNALHDTGLFFSATRYNIRGELNYISYRKEELENK